MRRGKSIKIVRQQPHQRLVKTRKGKRLVWAGRGRPKPRIKPKIAHFKFKSPRTQYNIPGINRDVREIETKLRNRGFTEETIAPRMKRFKGQDFRIWIDRDNPRIPNLIIDDSTKRHKGMTLATSHPIIQHNYNYPLTKWRWEPATQKDVNILLERMLKKYDI